MLIRKSSDNRSIVDEIINDNDSSIIYPNPSSGLFYIRSTNGSNVHLVVKDIQGRIIKELDLITNNELELDLSDYQGVNFIHLH